MSLASGLKTALKWTFKAAVLGIGLGIGSELITEFLTYGMMHGTSAISHALASYSLQFTEPITHALDGWIGGEAGLSWLKAGLKGIHEFFGIHNTFLPPILSAPHAPPAGALGGLSVPGL